MHLFERFSSQARTDPSSLRRYRFRFCEMKRQASPRLSGKAPTQAKKFAGNVINDDDSDDEVSQTVPQTQTKSKFLMRTGHGTAAQLNKLSPSMMDVRIHKCLYTKDSDQGSKIGQPTGNFMLAVSTPMGPVGERGKWLPIWKSLMDTARLNQNIQCVLLFSPCWDTLNCDMRHSKFKLFIKSCVRG